MDKEEALRILIEASDLLGEKEKEELLDTIPLLTDEDINNYGKFFAMEAKINFESFSD